MHSRWAVVMAVVLALVALATGLGAALATEENRRAKRVAIAELRDTNGQRVGVAFFTAKRGQVSVDAAVWRLTPGYHGFHVHTVGVCEPPFTSAGGHYNPGGASHGDHAGDLPTLLVKEDGTAELRFETDRFSLRDLSDMDGSALMIHAGRDNYANIPDRYQSSASDTPGPDADTLATGDAGARAACGVVKRIGRW